MRNWTPLQDKVARLDKRLDTLTAKPSRERTPAEVGQISELARSKRRLVTAITECRQAYLGSLARMGLDS